MSHLTADGFLPHYIERNGYSSDILFALGFSHLKYEVLSLAMVKTNNIRQRSLSLTQMAINTEICLSNWQVSLLPQAMPTVHMQPI